MGLVTNPSGVDRYLNSTVDILYNAPDVELVALYGPEHGVRGDVYAGGHITDTKQEAFVVVRATQEHSAHGQREDADEYQDVACPLKDLGRGIERIYAVD